MNILNKLNNFCYILHKFMGNLVTFKKDNKILKQIIYEFCLKLSNSNKI